MKDVKERYFKKVYIDNSIIAGTGLFAGEDIDEGDLILTFGGRFCLNTDRYSGTFLRSTCIGVNEDIMLGETNDDNRTLSDYINHSCAPNIGLDDALSIVAIQNISKGSELVCDYAFWENDNNWVMKTNCKCGSNNCRHIITGKDWVNFSSGNNYFKFFSPYLRRRILNNEKK